MFVHFQRVINIDCLTRIKAYHLKSFAKTETKNKQLTLQTDLFLIFVQNANLYKKKHH